MATKRTPQQAAAGRFAATMRAQASRPKAPAYCKKMTGPWFDIEGRQCFCDGYRAVRLVESVPDIDTECNPAHNFNLDNIMNRTTRNYSYSATLDLPTVSDLRRLIREDHAKQRDLDPKLRSFKPTSFYFPGGPKVNAQFLLDMLILLPGALCTWFDDYTSPVDGPRQLRRLGALIFWYPEQGTNYSDGLLLPCRMSEEEMKNNA